MPENLEEALNVYKNNLREIIVICKKRNQNILMLTHPSMWRGDLPQNMKDLLWEYVFGEKAYTVEALEKILRAYNNAMLDVCREEGVMCIDIDAMVPKDTSAFYDDAHLNIAGCELVSELIANRMIELLK